MDAQLAKFLTVYMNKFWTHMSKWHGLLNEWIYDTQRNAVDFLDLDGVCVASRVT